MCEMCETAASVFKEKPVDGLFLVRATRNGEMMDKGDLGLVEANFPIIYWQPGKPEWASAHETWDYRWKEVRRIMMRDGLGGKKFNSVPKGDAFADFLIREITKWAEGKELMDDPSPIEISAVNKDADLVRPAIRSK